MPSFEESDFNTNYEEIPTDILATMKRWVLDTFGVANVGTTTQASKIVTTYSEGHWCAGNNGPTARTMFKGTPP